MVLNIYSKHRHSSLQHGSHIGALWILKDFFLSVRAPTHDKESVLIIMSSFCPSSHLESCPPHLKYRMITHDLTKMKKQRSDNATWKRPSKNRGWWCFWGCFWNKRKDCGGNPSFIYPRFLIHQSAHFLIGYFPVSVTIQSWLASHRLSAGRFLVINILELIQFNIDNCQL